MWVDKGLAASRYGVVVISEHFIGKKWPEKELGGLVSKEMAEGRKIILPVWLDVSHKGVVEFSPMLADLYAIIKTDQEIEDISIQLLRAIRPDLYKELAEKFSREQIIQLAKGTNREHLQADFDKIVSELEEVKEKLSEFQCDHCGASLVESTSYPVSEDADDLLVGYDCGRVEGGTFPRCCPSDPNFPKLEEYDLITVGPRREDNDDWVCIARPKTYNSQRHHLGITNGKTENEVRERLIEQYRKSLKN